MARTKKCATNQAQISPKRGRGRPRKLPKKEALPIRKSPPPKAKTVNIRIQNRKSKKAEQEYGYYKGVPFLPNAVTSLQKVAENILKEFDEFSTTAPITAKQDLCDKRNTKSMVATIVSQSHCNNLLTFACQAQVFRKKMAKKYIQQ
ncbi:hypothetical protein DdX_07865 [Ditylenchus destructor]|uniref:Uncharacterized protein n=1 Tax=Ditylenchus destructor TaxID=166010 RepID=A0AAD4N8Q7_9BILA|nr:hypothetical protein DdX_07865 [Ditylenchus destructor]